MLEESQYYIEWTAAEAQLGLAGELVEMQRMIALWCQVWLEAQPSAAQRILLYIQAKKWSD